MSSSTKRKLNVRLPCLWILGATLATAMTSGLAQAQDLTKITVGTNWFAEAEHGGFYEAKALGIYKKYGLDVTIKMGGPQVNNMQLLLAGRQDFSVGYPIANLNAVQQGLPVVTIAGCFQSDPQGLIAHQNIKTLAGVKGHPVLLAASAMTTFWPWLKAKYGFTDSMARPYNFSVQPFLADKSIVQQGYVTSEVYAIEKAGVTPNVFLFADYGYPPYATTIETTRGMISKNPDVVRRFVKATMLGWKHYMVNPAPGNVLIKKANPQMTDPQLAFGLKKMKQYKLVEGGDAKTHGIGYMTNERWKKTFAFMAKAKLLKPGLDYKKAYTLKFLPQPPVLP